MANSSDAKPKPLVLIILDGWGHTENTEHNPIRQVSTPTFDQFAKTCPETLLQASGEAVGLPQGQMGNSEVGHLHLGAGRKVPQDLTRIDQAIADGSFYTNPVLVKAIEDAKAKDKAVHVLGLVSPGGVHSRDDQIAAVLRLVHQLGVKKNYCHAFLDGRDTPPKSALGSIEKINELYQSFGSGKIASLVGRYYAMDRDKRWQRTEKAYELLTQGIAERQAETAALGLEAAYAAGETDEFVKPTSIHVEDEAPITLQDGDVVIFMNFRADRARQLSHALLDKDFNEFKRQVVPKLSHFITLTQYAKDLAAEVAFEPIQLHNTLGEYIAAEGLTQLRIAETEKYAHVTYFLNGGQEKPFKHEDRILVQSPKVATYDLKPAMSAIELTDKLTKAIESNQYDVIVCNYANPDMVGHTGIEKAADEAVATIDQCIKRVWQSLQKVGGEMLITADHGNVECMYDQAHQQPHTAHTTNLVPLIYVGRPAHFVPGEGCLDNVAPTMLYLLNLPQPAEMTGKNLLVLDKG